MACNMRNDNSAIRFFKIITTASLEAGKLVIPNDFTKIYSSGMANPVFLKTPDDKKWKIFWEKHDGYVWFHKGWKDFTSYYSLDHGHLLLFNFIDTSHFDVLIFDNKNTFEIEYPMIHGNQDEHDNNPVQIMSDNSLEILEEMPPCKRTRQKSPISCPQPLRKVRSHISGDVGSSSKVQNLSKQEKKGGTSGLKHLTPKIGEASKTATTFKSKNPSFKVVMQASYIGGYGMYVPSYFAETYLKKYDGDDVVLKVLDGRRTWTASFGLGQIRNGWRRFVSDNDLKKGDVCVFKLIKKHPLTFKVFINIPPPPQDV